jgi:nitrogen fixation protein
MRSLALLLILSVATPALSAPLPAKNGSTINVKVEGKRERGIGLKAQANGWRLELRGAASGTAEVVDVTQGALGSKWMVSVEDGALVFDAARFVAGHAYRVELKSGSALVYLYPPTSRKSHSVVFADSEAPAADDGIAITPKSAL